MGFLNPLLLLGAFGALIPLMIHLWSRRQAKTVDFSSLRFLLEAHRKSVRRLQLRQWLILLLRMLIVALLAIAFARPLLKSQFSIAGSRIHTSCVIVLDNSYSMGYEDVTGNRFEQAQRQAISIAETLQRGDQASLILMSDRPEVIFPTLTTDLAQVAQAIRNADTSERATSIRASLEAAYRLLEVSDSSNKELYLITDLTRAAWSDWDESVVRPGIRLFLVPVGEADAPNIAVEEIRTPNPLMGIGIPTRFEARIRNHSNTQQQTSLSLIVDDQKQREIGLTLESDASLTQTFNYTFQNSGQHKVLLQLREDRLALDDRYLLVADVAGSQPVLCVEERNYLRLAIQPSVPATPTAPSLFQPTSLSYEEFEALGSLDVYPLVVIGDLSRLTPASLRRLTSYTQGGGRLLAFTGAGELDTASLSLLLNLDVAVPSTLPLPANLALTEPSHPLFAATPPPFFAPPAGPQFYQIGQVAPAVGDPSPRVLATLTDPASTPAILEGAGGKVLLFNTSLTEHNWTDLPLHPTFVPLIQQACLALIQGAQPTTDWTVGTDRSIPLEDATGSHAELRAEGTTEPEPIILQTDRSTDPIRAERTGFYELRYTTSEGTRSRLFAVNADRAESDLRTYTVDEARRLLGGAHLLDETQPLRDELNRYRTGREIWGQLILLSFALMMIELFLSNSRRNNP